LHVFAKTLLRKKKILQNFSEKVNYSFFAKIFAKTKKFYDWCIFVKTVTVDIFLQKNITTTKIGKSLSTSMPKLENAIFFSSLLRWVVCYCRRGQDLSDRQENGKQEELW
jgi:hypothetical protein